MKGGILLWRDAGSDWIWRKNSYGGESMDEMVRIVSEKTGLPAETARTAVEAVLGYLKEKLPVPIASQIDGVLGNTGTSGGPGDLLGGLGGLLDRK